MADYPNGIKFPFRVQPAGGIGLVSGASKISSNLSSLVLTAIKERLIYKSIGTVGYSSVMRTASGMSLIKALVLEAISKYEPRVSNVRVNVTNKLIDGAQYVYISVNFVYKYSGEHYSFELNLR